MTSTINLGTYAINGESFYVNLISPFYTSDGSTYYLLDANGDGTADNIAGRVADAVLRQTLDSFFNNGSDTTSAQRTVTISSYNLSLPTIAEFIQIRDQAGGLPPNGWVYVAGDGQVSTYHTADRYAADSHSIFGLTNGVTYSRSGLEIDSVSRQFVAFKVKKLDPNWLINGSPKVVAGSGGGNGIVLNGPNDYLTLSSGDGDILNVGSDDFSVAFSILIPNDRNSTTGVILANNTLGGLGVRLGTGYLKDLNGLSLFARNTADLSSVNYDWRRGEWNSVLIERKNQELKFFINGEKVAHKDGINGGAESYKFADHNPNINEYGSPEVNGSELSIGIIPVDAIEALNAGIDNVRINSMMIDFESISGKAVTTKTVPIPPSPTHVLSSSADSVNEGASVTFTLTTSGIASGVKIPYIVYGVDRSDVSSGSLSGYFTVGANGQATATINLVADKKTEGPETLTLSAADQSVSVTVNDTSTTPVPTYKLTPSAASVNEGGTLTFSIATTNVSGGTSLRYELTGIQQEDIVGGDLDGDVTVASNGTASVKLLIAADNRTEGDESLTFRLYDGAGNEVGIAASSIKDTSTSTGVKTVVDNGTEANLPFGLYIDTSGKYVLDDRGLAVGDALDGAVVLKTTKGANWAPQSAFAALVKENDTTAVVFTRSGTGAAVAYTEQKFVVNTGVASGSETRLNLAQVLARETLYGADINGDDRIGDAVAKVVFDGEGFSYGLYQMASGGLSLAEPGVNQGDTPDAAVPLTVSGKAWSLPAGLSVAGVLPGATNTSYQIITTKGIGAKASFASIAVDSKGTVGKTTNMTLPGVMTLEVQHQVDLNGDGAMGEAVAAVLWDEGGRYGLYQMGSGALVIAESGVSEGDSPQNIVSLKSGTKGWTVPNATVVTGVIEGGAAGSYQLITAKGFGAKASFASIAVDSKGVVGKSTALTIPQLLALESASELDLNSDGEVGDVITKVVFDGGGEQAVYQMGSGGYSLARAGLSAGDSAADGVALMSGKAGWVPRGTVVAIQTHADGTVGLMLQSGTGSKATYTDQVFSAAGVTTTVRGKSIAGTANDETLMGTGGNDTITGGGGADELLGGAGVDTFVYKLALETPTAGMDTIVDFTGRDKLDLKGIDADVKKSGDQAFVFGAKAANNSVWWVSQESDRGTLYGDVNGDATADFGIEIDLVGLSQMEAKYVVL